MTPIASHSLLATLPSSPSRSDSDRWRKPKSEGGGGERGEENRNVFAFLGYLPPFEAHIRASTRTDQTDRWERQQKKKVLKRYEENQTLTDRQLGCHKLLAVRNWRPSTFDLNWFEAEKFAEIVAHCEQLIYSWCQKIKYSFYKRQIVWNMTSLYFKLWKKNWQHCKNLAIQYKLVNVKV